ncbi:hypothetical protein F4859DRAFT_418618 [Xylaria cf. heliscus]|nr:hypothetical protein F4859DRAFT_418618 [Xylaria cf. heliscus]
MGVQQSKEAAYEQDLGTSHSGVPESGNCAAVSYGASAGEGKSSQQHSSCLLSAVDLSAVKKASPAWPSCPSTLGAFKNSQINNGNTPETAITINSDSEDDLATLLRKHRKRHDTNIHKVIRHDDWKSLDIDWWNNRGIHGNKLHKTKPTSRSKNRIRKRAIEVGHKGDARKPKSRTRSLHNSTRTKNTTPGPNHLLAPPPKNNRKRPCVHDREHGLDVCKTNSLIERRHPIKKSRVTPQITRSLSLPPSNQIRSLNESHEELRSNIFKVKRQSVGVEIDRGNEDSLFQVNHFPEFRSNIESTASISFRGEKPAVRTAVDGEHKADDQIIKSQTKRSHKAKKSKLTPFRRSNHTFENQPNTVSEPDTLEEPQQDRHIVARIDSGELLKDTRPIATSKPGIHGPQLGRSNATNHDHNINQHFDHPLVLNHRPLEDIFHKCDQPSLPRTQSEERDAALIQQFEKRKRPREYVVPELKWGYTIKFVDSVDIILDDKDLEEKTMMDRSFADREKANEYLYQKTSPDVVGGIEAIAQRTTILEGPERLLKVDITLTNGEHFLMWVERGMVVLNDLKHKKRRQAQWKPTPRPKFPHYIVTCELITYETSPVTRSEEEEEEEDFDLMSVDDRDGGLGPLGMNIGLRIEKLPPATFTIREMANDHAARLFLKNSRVDERFAEASDVHWWKCNALPEHRRAVVDARRPDGLYELAMEAHDMNSRLGWDQILVHVHEVDDVAGPVNF